MEKTPIVLHKIKTVFFYSIAIVVITIAIGVSGLRLVLTTANLYQKEVEQLASDLLEQPVKIGRMDAKLSGLIPTIIFNDVQLLSKKTNKPLFFLTRIDVGLSYEKLIWQQEIIPEQVTIRGMNLHVTRKRDGSFKVKGLDIEGLNNVDKNESSSMFETWLLQQAEVGLEDSTFTWVDEQKNKLAWYFEDVNFLLKKNKSRHQLTLSSQLPHVLGNKIELSLDLHGDITTPSTWDVKAYIESKGLKLSPLKQYIKGKDFKLISGVADYKLWLDWENKKLKQLSGDLRLQNIAYQLKKNKTVKLNLVTGIFDSRLDENNIWNVSVDKFNYKSDARFLNESKFSLALNFNDGSVESLNIKANYLKLETVAKIITDNHLVKQKHENIIKHLNVGGEIRDFYVGWKENKLQKVKADFSGLGFNSWETIPEVSGLSGNITYEKQKGIISLSSNDALIGFPSLFRENFKLDQLSANIIFSNTKEGFLFDANELSIKNSAVDAVSTTKLWVPVDGTSPHIDLQVYVSKGDISKTSQFLPVTIMNKDLVGWIDRSLQQGNINKATVILNGNLNDFPYDNKEGLFSVDIEASDLLLSYRDGWPNITNAKIIAGFTGQGFNMHFLSGEAKGNAIQDSYAEIKSFSKSELSLDISAIGTSYTAAQFLINSPILSDSKKVVRTMRFSGGVTTKVKVNIPLSDELIKEKPLSYTGAADFYNVAVFMLNDKIDITNTTGTLFFNEKGLSSKNITGNIINEKSKFTVTSSLKNKGIKIAMKGKIKPNIVLKRFNIPGAKNISGETPFTAEMIFPDKATNFNKPSLKMFSTLVGIKSNFPDFLYKKEKTPNEFYFTTVFSEPNKIQFSATVGKHGSAIIELDQSGKSSYLNRGAISFSKNIAVLPSKNILYIDGFIGKIKPSKWVDALDLKNIKGDSPFFVNPVIFNLEHLELLSRSEDEAVDDSHAPDPTKLPVFEGIIKKLYLDSVLLGRLDLKMSKQKYGLHFDEVILSAKNMRVFSHGDWVYKSKSHKTEMDFTLSSNDFGGMLGELDFSAVIRKGVAQASGKLEWWGPPTQFALKKLNGNARLKITDGNIKEVDAKAGRLLGLFSLSALPRKLFGDFSGTFKSGFSFDVAEGTINIEDGDAYTDDFEISSPVAEIYINGRTGLADRDYENTVEVFPDVSGGLAGITALLVNLPAGIGFWLVDKITGEQFNEASSKIYEISGSWESPEIEEIDEN